MSDLLPPSPSPFPIPPHRTAKSSATLPQPSSTASSSTTSLNSLSSYANQSSTDLRLGSDMASSSFPSHGRSLSLGGANAPLPSDVVLSGPPLRPLDLAPLMHSHEATHTELARTVDELQQWMAVVEAGLTQMLERPSQDTIEEEQEDVVLYDRNAAAAAAVGGSRGHNGVPADESFVERDGRTASDSTATPGSFGGAVPVALE